MVQEFESQEAMDAAFEKQMEDEQRKAELKIIIMQKESDIEVIEYDLEEARSELHDLQEELEELEP